MVQTIGKFHRPSGTVALTVTHRGITITRPVNACLTPDGKHDLAATRARAEAVARGLRVKIEKGVIAAPDSQSTISRSPLC